MQLPRNRSSVAGAIVAVLLLAVAVYVWAGTMVAATGGVAISADTAAVGGSATWTNLTGPSYRENINGDIASGGLVTLTAPAGFAFNPAVTVSVVLAAGDRMAAANMNEAAVGGNVASTVNGSLTVTATTISFFVSSKSRGNTLNTIQWRGIQVMPRQGSPLASGNIALGLPGGSAFPSSFNAGTLTVVPGAFARLLTVLPGQTFATGTAVSGAAVAQTAGTPFSLQLVSADRFNNQITDYSGARTISYTGPAVGCSAAPIYTSAVDFTSGRSTTVVSTTLFKVETTSITASDGTVSGPASSGLTVNPAAMSHLLVTLPGQTFIACAGNTGTPANQAAGVSFNIASITATDRFFNVISGYAGTKTISYSGPTGPAAYTTSVSFSAGQSTSALATTIANAQDTTISASDGTISGPASSLFKVNASVDAFNAFETATPSAALAGVVKTKIADAAFALDLIAVTSTPAISGGFTGAVRVEIVDSSSGACAALPRVQLLPEQTFTTGDGGRHRVTGIVEANAWKNVRIRISHPAGSPTIVSCSGDNFSIRPDRLGAAQASDFNETTPGTSRTLANIDIDGGAVHKAGQPFTMTATAMAAGGAATTNYTGAPVAILSACSTAACPPLAETGVLSITSWSSMNGGVSTSNATYSEVGAFALMLQDQSFANVDAADSTTAERYISSSMFSVGRFIPDHFVATAVGIVPRADIAACAASSFTYLDEPFQLSYKLVAQNAAPVNATTLNYEGPRAKLDSANAAHLNVGAIDTGTATALTARLLASASAGAWSRGEVTVSTKLQLRRAPAPDGPFNTVSLGVAPRDADGVTLAAFNLDADANGTNERFNVGTARLMFGRLKLGNAYGNELLNMRIPIQAQFWTGTGFRQNALDNCTTIANTNVLLSNHRGGITASNMASPGNVGMGAAFNAGVGSLMLKRPVPPPSLKGSVDITIALLPEAKRYLQGRGAGPLFDQDPSSRATFGLFKSGPVIYVRETY